MIYGLDLEGFQPFGLKQQIEFKPLTLIFGPNSVGKSSIGRALRLLSQSQKAGGGLQYAGDLLQLSGFADASYKRRTGQSAFVRLGLRLHLSQGRQDDGFHLKSCLIEMVFAPQDPERPAWIQIAGVLDYHGPDGTALQGSFVLVLSRIFDPFWSPDSEPGRDPSPLGHIVDEAKITSFFVSGLGPLFDRLVGLAVSDDTELLQLAQSFNLKNETGSERRQRTFEEVFGNFSFRFSRPTAYRGLNLLPALRMPPRDQVSLLHTFVRNLIRKCASGLDESVAQFQYIGPLRNVTSAYVPPTHRTVKLMPDASNLQEHLTSLSRTELGAVSDALESLTDGQYGLEEKVLPSHLVGVGGYKQVVLRDNFLKSEVTLSNAGTGISQVLPIVAGMLAMSSNTAETQKTRRPFGDPELKDILGGLLFVEQPELHLHPAMQARLADYLLENSSDGLATNLERGRGKPIVVCETHSEAIMLRVISRIKKGDVSSKDVAIYFVDRFPDWDSSHAILMEIDGEGHFKHPWPLSFSDVRNQERFDW